MGGASGLGERGKAKRITGKIFLRAFPKIPKKGTSRGKSKKNSLAYIHCKKLGEK